MGKKKLTELDIAKRYIEESYKPSIITQGWSRYRYDVQFPYVSIDVFTRKDLIKIIKKDRQEIKVSPKEAIEIVQKYCEVKSPEKAIEALESISGENLCEDGIEFLKALFGEDCVKLFIKLEEGWENFSLMELGKLAYIEPGNGIVEECEGFLVRAFGTKRNQES